MLAPVHPAIFPVLQEYSKCCNVVLQTIQGSLRLGQGYSFKMLAYGFLTPSQQYQGSQLTHANAEIANATQV